MLVKHIISACTALLLIATPIPQEADDEPLTHLGAWRISEYCAQCSTGTTSLGEPCQEDICASDPNAIPYGSIVVIDGEEYRMADYCGYAVNTEPTVDICRVWSDGKCHCSRLEYIDIYIK